jgi:hypothetical protein
MLNKLQEEQPTELVKQLPEQLVLQQQLNNINKNKPGFYSPVF